MAPPPSATCTERTALVALVVAACSSPSRPAPSLAATVEAPPRVCLGTWCFDNPRPLGALPLQGVWAAAPTDVWVVGEVGAILHFDGSTWTGDVHPTVLARNSMLMDIAGRSATDIWAVGLGGVVLHYDGAMWRDVDSGTTKDLLSVALASDGSVWAAGESGMLLRWNGRVFETRTSGLTEHHIQDVEVVSPTEIWVSAPGAIMRGDGVTMTRVDSHGTGETVTGLWHNADGLWVVDRGGDVLRWADEHWTLIQQGTRWPRLEGVAGVDATLVGVGDGGAWRGSRAGGTFDMIEADLKAVWMLSKERTWAVGSAGELFTHDGKQWSSMRQGDTGSLVAAWGADGELWAVGERGTAQRFSDGAWHALPTGTSSTLYAVWGRSRDAVWAAGERVVMHWNGTRWTDVTPEDFDTTIVDIAGSERDVWLLGTDAVWRISGATWQRFEGSPYQQSSIAAARGGRVAMLTRAALLWHDPAASDEMPWKEDPRELSGYSGLWMSPTGGEIVVVGPDIQILTPDTTRVVKLPPGIEYIEKHWIHAPDDVWVMDREARVAHWNGATWRMLPVGPPSGLRGLAAIYAPPRGEPTLFGASGMILTLRRASDRKVPWLP